MSGGSAAIAVLVSAGAPSGGRVPAEPTVSLSLVTQSRRLLRRRAKAVGELRRQRTLRWLVDNPDVFAPVAKLATDAAERATARLDDDARQRLRLPSDWHIVCEALAQVALAMQDAIEAAQDAVAEDLASGHDPAVAAAFRALAEDLAAKAVSVALDATGLTAALRMARIGAVATCPNAEAHPAVRTCAAALVEEPATDEITGSLRQAALGLLA